MLGGVPRDADVPGCCGVVEPGELHGGQGDAGGSGRDQGRADPGGHEGKHGLQVVGFVQRAGLDPPGRA